MNSIILNSQHTMKAYKTPTCRILTFLSEPLFQNTIGNGGTSGEETEDDGGWTRRFDWQEPNDKDNFFY